MLRGNAIRDLADYYDGYNATGYATESPTGDFVSSAKDYANKIKTGTVDLANTHPKEWTANQYLGVATGIVALWSLILMGCIIKGCCDKRRRKQLKEVDDGYMNMTVEEKTQALIRQHKHAYNVVRPNVIRGPDLYGGGDYDAMDSNRLPLGARLHGAYKLRRDGLTGHGVRVAIIDSGIDHKHPGFHDKVITKRWFRYGTSLQKDDHGTHVAGTIHFMAPNADLFDYRVFGENGDFDTDLAIAKSIRSAVDIDKCHVINMSLRCSYPVLPEIAKAVMYAKKKGVHMVCAAGNDGDGNPLTDELYSFPALFDETISVAAVQKEDGLPATNFSESNSKIDFSGIGRDVISLKPGGGLQSMSGTSMAAPHVTGLIACLLSNQPQKYNDSQLRKLLRKKYVVDIAEKGFDKQTGAGFLTYLSGVQDIMDKEEFFELLSVDQERAV